MSSSCSRVALLVRCRRGSFLRRPLQEQQRFIVMKLSNRNPSGQSSVVSESSSYRSLSSSTTGGGGRSGSSDRRFGWKRNPKNQDNRKEGSKSNRPLRKDQSALRKHKGHRVKSRGMGSSFENNEWDDEGGASSLHHHRNNTMMAAKSPLEVFGRSTEDNDDDFTASNVKSSFQDYERHLQKTLLSHNGRLSSKSLARLLDTKYSFPQVQNDRISFAQVLPSNDDSIGHHHGRHPHVFHQENGLDYHYWKESDFDSLLDNDEDDAALFQPDEDGHVFIERNEEDGMVTIYYDDQEHNRAFFTNYNDDEIFDKTIQEQVQQQRTTRDTTSYRSSSSSSSAPITSYDPEEQYFHQGVDLFQVLSEEDKNTADGGGVASLSSDGRWYDSIAPLKIHGPNLDDFLSAMQEHPTKYAQVKRVHQHPDSLRQPKPDIPPNRSNPPPEFVTSYQRFLYVFGLPTSNDGNGNGDSFNSLAQQELQKTLTRYFRTHCDISLLAAQIYPANATSAFVGFHSEEDLEIFLQANHDAAATAAREGSKKDGDGDGGYYFQKPLEISLFDKSTMETKDLSSFLEGHPEGSVLQLDCIPPGQTKESLCRDLFPKGGGSSEEDQLAQLYHMEPQDIMFLGPQKALIKYSSAEKAKAALESSYVQECLERMGVYPVRMLRARRDLVFMKWGGPAKQQPIREMGTKLIVDGDMPSKAFYLSHANTLLLRNLNIIIMDHEDDPKWQISQVFQPYSLLSRDIQGSIEIPTCLDGIPLGKAYVGFDRVGEMYHAFSILKGSVKIGDQHVIMKKTKERPIPRKNNHTTAQHNQRTRPDRPVEELLNDLNNWEQHVDPADVTFLQQNGIAKEVLDEALRGIRYHNVTFGAFDQGKGEETFVSHQSRGQEYRELVQEYIATLKECVATPENPGLYFDAMHMPGEQWDLSYFDREKKRQKKFTQRRQSGPSTL